MYVRGKRLQKGSTHSGSALQQRRTDGRRHTRETTETGACDYTARSWKGRRNEKGDVFSAPEAAGRVGVTKKAEKQQQLSSSTAAAAAAASQQKQQQHSRSSSGGGGGGGGAGGVGGGNTASLKL